MGQRALDEIESVVPNFKRKVLIEGAGHWIQQERPDEVNAALIGFAREHLNDSARPRDAISRARKAESGGPSQ